MPTSSSRAGIAGSRRCRNRANPGRAGRRGADPGDVAGSKRCGNRAHPGRAGRRGEDPRDVAGSRRCRNRARPGRAGRRGEDPRDVAGSRRCRNRANSGRAGRRGEDPRDVAGSRRCRNRANRANRALRSPASPLPAFVSVRGQAFRGHGLARAGTSRERQGSAPEMTGSEALRVFRPFHRPRNPQVTNCFSSRLPGPHGDGTRTRNGD